MLAKIREFVKAHLDTVLLISVAAFFVLFAFAAGYLIATYQQREPLIINDASLQ